MRPKAARVAATSCFWEPQSLTSQATASARAGPPSSAASASSLAAERAASTTR